MTSNSLSVVSRGVALAALFAVTSPVGVFATDLPLPMYTKAPPAPVVAPPYDWSGFYVGGHLGYLWGRTHVDDDGVTAERNARTDGIIGGAMLGYNWQINRIVFGLEGDFGWTNARGVGAETTDPGGGTGGSSAGDDGGGTTTPPTLVPVITHAANHYDVRWTSHVRGRVGYAFDNWLIFAAGGFAAADLNFREGAISIDLVPAPNSGGKYYGWSIGGGVEWAFTRNLFARVEYLYDDFGHKDYVGALGDRYRVSLTGQTVRGALGFKFDPLAR
jgi:outer membrane immunogenic protein